VADPNRALFESVVRLLAPVLDELVFVGGCTTGIFVTDPAAGGIRPTRDVDAIVDVTTYAQYAGLADRLRTLGLVEDTSEGAPLCRWRHGIMVIDVMPTDASVLGFSNRWYPTAIDTAQRLRVAGHAIRVVSPALFVATKLEAFHGRGGDESSAVTTSKTSSPSWTAARRLLTMSLPPMTRFGPILPRRCERCSTTRTSSRRCRASSSRIRQVRRAGASWKTV
jgi:hypothetical protein